MKVVLRKSFFVLGYGPPQPSPPLFISLTTEHQPLVATDAFTMQSRLFIHWQYSSGCATCRTPPTKALLQQSHSPNTWGLTTSQKLVTRCHYWLQRTGQQKPMPENFHPCLKKQCRKSPLVLAHTWFLLLRQPFCQDTVLVRCFVALSHSLVLRKNFGLLCILHPVALFQKSSPWCPLRTVSQNHFFHF